MKKTNLTRIYYLHRGDEVPVYIGKTIRNKNERLNNHISERGEKFWMEEIDVIPTEEWVFWEKYYINLFKTWGFALENKNMGGGGCITHKVSPEARLKIGNTHRGRKKPFSESHIENLRKSLKGKIHPPSHGENISKILKNRKVTWKTGISSKPIFQYDLQYNLIRKWESTVEAVKSYSEAIRECALGKQKTSHGYIWRYEKK